MWINYLFYGIMPVTSLCIDRRISHENFTSDGEKNLMGNFSSQQIVIRRYLFPVMNSSIERTHAENFPESYLCILGHLQILSSVLRK